MLTGYDEELELATIVWFTGLSGAGKSSLAQRLYGVLSGLGKKVKILDGDAVRGDIHKNLGFSPEAIKTNNRLIAELCLKYQKDYDYLLVAVIAPFEMVRRETREILGDSLVEVYVKASLETVIKRDCKGLYKKALRGEIPNFIGISPDVPYEVPVNPDLTIDTEALDVESSTSMILEYIHGKNK
jgi:adenylylsulfate kinase